MTSIYWVESDPRWLWIDDIQVGDILLEKGKSPRVVRKVSRIKKGPRTGKVHALSFTIKKCSWTGACHTTIVRTDLKTRKFSPTGKKAALNGELDKQIEANVALGDNTLATIHCCDVKGVF